MKELGKGIASLGAWGAVAVACWRAPLLGAMAVMCGVMAMVAIWED